MSTRQPTGLVAGRRLDRRNLVPIFLARCRQASLCPTAVSSPVTKQEEYPYGLDSCADWYGKRSELSFF